MRRGDEKTKPDARPHTLLTLVLNTGIKKAECTNIHLNHLDPHTRSTPRSGYATRTRADAIKSAGYRCHRPGPRSWTSTSRSSILRANCSSLDRGATWSMY